MSFLFPVFTFTSTSREAPKEKSDIHSLALFVHICFLLMFTRFFQTKSSFGNLYLNFSYLGFLSCIMLNIFTTDPYGPKWLNACKFVHFLSKSKNTYIISVITESTWKGKNALKTHTQNFEIFLLNWFHT